MLGFERQTYLASESQGWVLVRVSVTVGVPMDGLEMQLQTFPLSAQCEWLYANANIVLNWLTSNWLLCLSCSDN